jgi:hypothetical protein
MKNLSPGVRASGFLCRFDMSKRRNPEYQGPKNGMQKLGGPVQPGSQFARAGCAGVVLQAQSDSAAAPINSVTDECSRRCAFAGRRPRKAVAQ